ncbi:MAG: alanine racemase, partial [Actinomycetota bacterium]
MRVGDLPTPALVVDAGVLAANLDVMRDALPGGRLRPHVKAHKCTEVAREQVARGHAGLTVATPREALGLAAVGLGGDLLLANQVLDPVRLRALAECGARVTVAVDSDATVAAAAAAGIREVLVDVAVGMPRCGCDPAEAGRIAERARAAGLTVRGIMGYEGHVVGLESQDERVRLTADAMARLLEAHGEVGGELISAGGTGTYAVNTWANEIQAGSYALMDTALSRGLSASMRPIAWSTSSSGLAWPERTSSACAVASIRWNCVAAGMGGSGARRGGRAGRGVCGGAGGPRGAR